MKAAANPNPNPKATERWSFKLIKHCYEKEYEIPDKAFLCELDDWAEGNHVDMQYEEEECEATQVVTSSQEE